jgi:hypothetical protein
MASASADIPASRRLRIFAFDPSLAQRLQTAAIREIVIRVPWERGPDGGPLIGPIGDYIEVVDIDPSSGMVYPPVNLDDPSLLAQDGLRPSEGNPQFHQQMVYAVAMATIGQFERALGRVALWAARRQAPGESATGKWETQFVRRLRIYPHALRDQNAYYSPDKKALLFGYFPVRGKDRYNTPGTTVFTCLSHDIVAHEVTHALLDGIHPRFNEPSNPDVHAFHEAFADIVALFQHFSYAGVLRDQIARTRGNLDSDNLMGQLAQEFGRATGRSGALRDALGREVNGKWERRPPDPTVLETVSEPHARGAVLVAAVFRAFLLVYQSRIADLYRIATQGTGVLPEGDIHPDLAARLAEEGARCAQYILQMCIRALDYCPPVSITFGDYLRAIITADINLNPDDELGYRIAMVESFREWGIYPRGIRSMSIEALTWPSGAEVIAEADIEEATDRTLRSAPTRDEVSAAGDFSADDIKQLFSEEQPQDGEEDWDTPMAGEPAIVSKWDLHSDRLEVWKNMQRNRRALWRWLVRGAGRKYAHAFGVVVDPAEPRQTIYRNRSGEPTVEIHSVRTALRRDARGAIETDLVVEITQRRRGYFDPAEQEAADTQPAAGGDERADFKFRAGCTIVIDTTRNAFRHIIRTPGTPGTVSDDIELDRVRRYLTGEAGAETNAFDGVRALSLRERSAGTRNEPFALLHRHVED